MMFPDLTQVNVPFGLLDRETQEALKAHGGPWEFWCPPGDWIEMDDLEWAMTCVYRVKPAPPKPRELWIEFGPNGRVWHVHTDGNPQFINDGNTCTLWREVDLKRSLPDQP